MSNETIDFDLSEYGPHYNRVSIILDPNEDGERPEVYTFACIGSGTPEPVYNNKHLDLFGVNRNVCVDDLQEWLEARADTLLEIAAGYEGTEWSGNNHVGQWSEEARELAHGLLEDAQSALAYNDIATRWDPADFYGQTGFPVDEAMDHDSIGCWAESEVENAEDSGQRLSHDELVDFIRERLEEWLDDADSDADQGLLGKVEALLA
jgi:hypothetical protein